MLVLAAAMATCHRAEKPVPAIVRDPRPDGLHCRWGYREILIDAVIDGEKKDSYELDVWVLPQTKILSCGDGKPTILWHPETNTLIFADEADSVAFANELGKDGGVRKPVDVELPPEVVQGRIGDPEYIDGAIIVQTMNGVWISERVVVGMRSVAQSGDVRWWLMDSDSMGDKVAVSQ